MLSSSLTKLKQMATPFKSAVTPMAQADAAVQLSRLCGCSEGSRRHSANGP